MGATAVGATTTGPLHSWPSPEPRLDLSVPRGMGLALMVQPQVVLTLQASCLVWMAWACHCSLQHWDPLFSPQMELKGNGPIQQPFSPLPF